MIEYKVPHGPLILKYDSTGLVEAGYEVFGDIPEGHGVFVASTPVGRAVVTVLPDGDMSSYPLTNARRAIADWCRLNGLDVTGDSSEVFEGSDGEAERGSLFLLIKEGS
jgi:hypothetical protein